MTDTENESKTKPFRRAHDLTSEDRATLIRELEFGSRLGEKTVELFAASSVVVDVRRRRFVYRAGEQADALYAIVKGRIKLCRLEPQSDREAVIDILPQGSMFGEYFCVAEDGHRFEAKIPEFVLSLPRTLH